MADEPIKQPGDTSAPANPGGNPAGNSPVNPVPAGQSSPFPKKRRRRPRRRKSSFKPGMPGVLPIPPVQEEKPVNIPEENLLEPTPLESVEETIKPEEQAIAEEPKAEELPVIEPEPEEVKPEEPSPFSAALKPEEAASAPKGWDQLKQAIKQDHEKTKEQLAAEKAAPLSGVTVSEPKKEAEAAKEEPKKESIPRVTPEEEQERKEVFKIILRYVVSGCAVIAIIVGLFFFKLPQMAFDAARNFFAGSQNQQGEQQIPEEETQVPTGTETESTGVKTSILAGENKAKSKEEFQQGVETALVTGQDVPKLRTPTSSIATVFMIGSENKEFQAQDTIGAYMSVLIRLQNAFKTDIHELLSKSPDREQALELHIKDLNTVQNDAKETVQQIKEKMDEIKVEYNQVGTLKDQLEKDFFNSMDSLEGTDANDILNQFIDVSKRYTVLKAQYSALDKTNQLFQVAVKNMETRIKDIEYNRAALIKGVKVVDIKGSDLELIIQESQL